MTEHILITGAASGIGRSLTLALVSEGKTVYAVDRNEANLTLLKKESPKLIHVIAVDLANQDGRDTVKASIPAGIKISHLVNCAGLMAPSGYLENVDLAAWRLQMAVNVEAPLFLTKTLLPILKGGRVLNLTTYCSFKVQVGLGSYGTSKAALNVLTEYLKAELKRHQIAVGIVLPGIVDTNIQSQLSQEECAEIIAHHNAQRKAGKLLTTQTVVKFLKWLLLETDNQSFSAGVWDIYDKKHHSNWTGGVVIPIP